MGNNENFGENLNSADNNNGVNYGNLGDNLGAPQGMNNSNNWQNQGQNPYNNNGQNPYGNDNRVNLNKGDYNYNQNYNYNYQNGMNGQYNNGYPNMNNGYNNNQQGMGGLFGDLDPNTQYMIWLISGIVQIVNICCCNVLSLVFGIIAVIFASKAKQGILNGDRNEFERNIKNARLISLIGWVVIVLNIILNIALGFFSAVMDRL